MPTSKKRKPIKGRKNVRNAQNIFIWLSTALLLVLAIFFWHYKDGLTYYFRSVTKSHTSGEKEQLKHDARNHFLMNKHADYVYGIDISQYQGDILWDSVSVIGEGIPLDFIFIRATMGERGRDKGFATNWKGSYARSKLRGAYHYYRPNENSIKQAKNFIEVVDLLPGDLPPVLDIEERPKTQSMDSLRIGLKRWIETIEGHYKCKPILYSGDSYFTDFLQEEFSDYILWIANYNFWIESPKDHWHFWQFSEKGTAKGINGSVDLNMYKGSLENLENLCLPYL